jgi:hypothetical protein
VAVRSEPQFAVISTAASGDTTLVAAVAGARIGLVGFFIVASGAVNLKLKGGATDLTGPMACVSGKPLTDVSRVSELETAAGQPLVLNLSAAVQVSGALVYQTVTG